MKEFDGKICQERSRKDKSLQAYLNSVLRKSTHFTPSITTPHVGDIKALKLEFSSL